MITYTFYQEDGSTRVLRVPRPLGQVEYKRKTVNVLDQLSEIYGSLVPLVKGEAVMVPDREKAKAKQALKTAIHAHKNLRKRLPGLYNEHRNALIKEIVSSRTPNWGSIKITPLR